MFLLHFSRFKTFLFFGHSKIKVRSCVLCVYAGTPLLGSCRLGYVEFKDFSRITRDTPTVVKDYYRPMQTRICHIDILFSFNIVTITIAIKVKVKLDFGGWYTIANTHF